jgi:hypothetical protein
MSGTPTDAVCPIFRCFRGYDTGASGRQLRAAKCINGNCLHIATIRQAIAESDAVVL